MAALMAGGRLLLRAVLLLLGHRDHLRYLHGGRGGDDQCRADREDKGWHRGYFQSLVSERSFQRWNTLLCQDEATTVWVLTFNALLSAGTPPLQILR